jgi:DNA-binding beta-propeller fold protein YncE
MRSSVAKACRRSRRQRSTVITLLLAGALVLALGGAQAQAAPKGVVDFFGGAGTGAGQFSTPSGVAVNGSTGHLYVVDSGNQRVQEFDVFGNFVRTWGYGVATGTATFEVCNAPAPCLAGISGADAGQLANPQGIAVDQVSGAVYVTNQDNGRIEKFDSSGNFLFAFGWGVDTGAAAVETCTTASACQAAASGSDAGQFATTFSGHVAVDPRNGDVVVADPANGRVQKFDSSGAFLFAFGWGVDTGAAALQTCTTASTCQAGTTGSGAGQFDFAQPTRVAVESSGSVYTVEGGNNRRVQKFNATASSAAVFAPEHASGTDDPSTAPTDVAVDPGNDHVLVAKDQQVLELDIAGGLVETHAVGAGLPPANGMAVDGSSNRIYLSTTPDQRIYVLGAITPPSATISPVTDVAAESATFNGTVNPNGGGKLSTGYHFEYSDDAGATWTPVPTPDADAGNGTSDVPVSQAVTGLEPNTDYRVRLVASRPFAGGSATSAEATFTTDAAPPTVSGVGSSEITDTTAVLGGRVDPNHSQTTYRFEYGTDTSYGTATPVDSAGSGASSVAVSKQITGLQPNTTYHFRLVATNPAGETEGDDHTFTTDANPPQPSGRAYEMVSPVDKNGGDISRDVSTASQLNVQTGAAASGDAVAFVSRSNFADPEAGSGGVGIPNYLARRGGDGWITEGVTPPVGRVFPAGSPEVPRVPGLALDASRSFGVSGALLTPEAERLNGSFGLYMRTAGETAGQRYTLLSVPWQTLPPDSVSTAVGVRFEWEASTPDGRHVVFSSSRRLLPGAPPDSTPSRPGAVYEWADGSLRLASVLPPGLSFLAANPTAFGGGGTILMSSGNLHGDNVISDDGRRLFFTANVQGAGRVLLVREDGAATRVVSASERPGDPPNAPKAGAFWAAKSTDGSVAFFTSSAPLTADAVIAPGGGSMVYRWDANAPQGQRLSAISPDPLGQPGVQGPAAVSDDATSVYFVASGELAPGATRGAQNLYVWRQGQGLRYVATLDGTTAALTGALDGPLWRTLWTRLGGRGARVSADGERLLFASYAQLDPAYDTVEESAEDCGDPDVAGDRCRQIYLYDAPSGRVSCLTCVAGAPVTGDANLFGNSDGRRPVGDNSQETVDAPLDLPHNLSADGRRAFFETARPLVAADENNAIDVYEWEDGDLDGEGELRLISSGRDATDSKFLAASLSGDDVFFTSRDRLVGIDTDNHVDLYDARIAGGFAAQNPSAPPPPCEGDDCQGTLSGAPFLPGVGSGGPSNGNLDPGPRPSFSLARLSREQKAQLARGRRVLVRVRVNRAGKVRLAARAKLGGRMRTVATASKTARKAGSLTLGVKLTRAALRELTRKGKLKVTLAVKFAGVREARNSTVRLRRARGAGERRPR